MVERKYIGILKTRLTISILGATDEGKLAEYTQACLDRDEALFAEFGIDPQSGGAWKELAFALAEQHVPAYGARKRGRPNKNADENISMLLRWQEVLRANGSSDADAIRIVANERGLTESIVRERIKEIKRSDLKMLVEFMDTLEAKTGKAKLLDAFGAIHDPDDGLADYIEVRKRELSRPPYK